MASNKPQLSNEAFEFLSNIQSQAEEYLSEDNGFSRTTCCDIVDMGECLECASCWWEEHSNSCYSNGGFNCETTQCIETPPTTEDQPDPITNPTTGDIGVTDGDYPLDYNQQTADQYCFLLGYQPATSFGPSTPSFNPYSGYEGEYGDLEGEWIVQTPVSPTPNIFQVHCGYPLEEEEEVLTQEQCTDMRAINYGTTMTNEDGALLYDTEFPCDDWFESVYDTEYPEDGTWLDGDGNVLPGQITADYCCFNGVGVTTSVNLFDNTNDGIVNVQDVVALINCILNDVCSQNLQIWVPAYSESDYVADCNSCEDIGQITCPDNSCADSLDDCETECPPVIAGCTDSSACNFDEDATVDNGSCEYTDNCFCGGTCIGDRGPCDCGGNCIAYQDGSLWVDDSGYDCDSNCGGPDGATIKILDCDGQCINESLWEEYRDNPQGYPDCWDGTVGEANFACSTLDNTEPEQLNNQFVGFNCANGRCVDECGVCGGSGIPDGACDCDGNTFDCNNVCGGPSQLDLCGVCGGDNSLCTGCMDESACNYDSNATEPGDCTYQQQHYDCFGNCVDTDCLGNCPPVAVVDECGVCNGDGYFECNEGTLVCDEIDCPVDCCGIPNGNGNTCDDQCGECGGDGSSCDDDCGVPNGDNTSCTDECGVVNGDNSTCTDECGVVNGDNSTCTDECGVVNGDNSTCTDECGVINGDNSICTDDCGIVNGDNSTCTDECGVVNGDNSICTDDCGVVNGDNSTCTDECGVINGDGTSCADCAGTPNGDAVLDCNGVCDGDSELDQCNVCGGDGTSCVGCQDETACNYDSNATIPGTCEYPPENYDCFGNCINYDCFGDCGGTAVLDYCNVCDGVIFSAADCLTNPGVECCGETIDDILSPFPSIYLIGGEENLIGSVLPPCEQNCEPGGGYNIIDILNNSFYADNPDENDVEPQPGLWMDGDSIYVKMCETETCDGDDEVRGFLTFIDGIGWYGTGLELLPGMGLSIYQTNPGWFKWTVG